MAASDRIAVPAYADRLGLTDRGFVVIGAGNGMGRQTAHALAQQGARVLCVDIDPERAETVADEVGGLAHQADATVAADMAGVAERARADLGRVHGLADVVGMARYSRLVDMPEEDWDWCHTMVVRHAFLSVRHIGPLLVAGGGGTMVFVASISGVSSAPFHGAYGAAKAGLISLVRTAAVELKEAEVRVNAVTPGNTATPRIAAAQGRPAEELATGRLADHGSVTDIASAILFFCSDLSRHITGQNLAVDGGDLAKFPHDLGSAPPLPAGAAMGEGGR